MGMSTHVIGFKPPDEKWKKMKAVWDSCKKAGIEVPRDVEQFFNWEPPDEQGVRVEIVRLDAVKPWSADMQEGWEVDLRGLADDIKVIRFYNSW